MAVELNPLIKSVSAEAKQLAKDTVGLQTLAKRANEILLRSSTVTAKGLLTGEILGKLEPEEQRLLLDLITQQETGDVFRLTKTQLKTLQDIILSSDDTNIVANLKEGLKNIRSTASKYDPANQAGVVKGLIELNPSIDDTDNNGFSVGEMADASARWHLTSYVSKNSPTGRKDLLELAAYWDNDILTDIYKGDHTKMFQDLALLVLSGKRLDAIKKMSKEEIQKFKSDFDTIRDKADSYSSWTAMFKSDDSKAELATFIQSHLGGKQFNPNFIAAFMDRIESKQSSGDYENSSYTLVSYVMNTVTLGDKDATNDNKALDMDPEAFETALGTYAEDVSADADYVFVNFGEVDLPFTTDEMRANIENLMKNNQAFYKNLCKAADVGENKKFKELTAEEIDKLFRELMAKLWNADVFKVGEDDSVQQKLVGEYGFMDRVGSMFGYDAGDNLTTNVNKYISSIAKSNIKDFTETDKLKALWKDTVRSDQHKVTYDKTDAMATVMKKENLSAFKNTELSERPSINEIATVFVDKSAGDLDAIATVLAEATPDSAKLSPEMVKEQITDDKGNLDASKLTAFIYSQIPGASDSFSSQSFAEDYGGKVALTLNALMTVDSSNTTKPAHNIRNILSQGTGVAAAVDSQIPTSRVNPLTGLPY